MKTIIINKNEENMYTVKITKQEALVLKEIITHWENNIQDASWTNENGVYDYEKTDSFIKKLNKEEKKEKESA